MNTTQISASVSFPQQAVHVYIREKDPEGGWSYLSPTGPIYAQAGEAVDPTATVSVESAQELFEQLWSQGFRSVHDRGNSDKLDAARKEHIDDLRSVAGIKGDER